MLFRDVAIPLESSNKLKQSLGEASILKSFVYNAVTFLTDYYYFQLIFSYLSFLLGSNRPNNASNIEKSSRVVFLVCLNLYKEKLQKSFFFEKK